MTIEDFFDFCKERNIEIEKSVYIKRGKINKNPLNKILTNLFCEEAIFIIKR